MQQQYDIPAEVEKQLGSELGAKILQVAKRTAEIVKALPANLMQALRPISSLVMTVLTTLKLHTRTISAPIKTLSLLSFISKTVHFTKNLKLFL